MLTNHQGQLRGYLLASLGDFTNTADVLQKTNLRIWQKASEYRRSEPFLPWAFGIARYEVLAFLRDRARDRIVFQPDVTEMLGDAAQQQLEQWPIRQEALHHCLGQLNDDHSRIFALRYGKGCSVGEVAEATGRTHEAVKSVMLRVRRTLREIHRETNVERMKDLMT